MVPSPSICRTWRFTVTRLSPVRCARSRWLARPSRTSSCRRSASAASRLAFGTGVASFIVPDTIMSQMNLSADYEDSFDLAEPCFLVQLNPYLVAVAGRLAPGGEPMVVFAEYIWM